MIEVSDGGKIPAQKLLEAIREFEGWYPGSVSYTRNNPCNLRAEGDLGMKGGFGNFSTYEKGVARCIKSIRWYTDRDVNLAGMIYAWAPASDGNFPATYTNFVADRLGVHYSSRLKDILTFQ